jgi:hypothetical protein
VLFHGHLFPFSMTNFELAQDYSIVLFCGHCFLFSINEFSFSFGPIKDEIYSCLTWGSVEDC